nr:ral guanine nucleotide dissociation stimulator-like isoform X1 [Equus asinus]
MFSCFLPPDQGSGSRKPRRENLWRRCGRWLSSHAPHRRTFGRRSSQSVTQETGQQLSNGALDSITLQERKVPHTANRGQGRLRAENPSRAESKASRLVWTVQAATRQNRVEHLVPGLPGWRHRLRPQLPVHIQRFCHHTNRCWSFCFKDTVASFLTAMRTADPWTNSKRPSPSFWAPGSNGTLRILSSPQMFPAWKCSWPTLALICPARSWSTVPAFFFPSWSTLSTLMPRLRLRRTQLQLHRKIQKTLQIEHHLSLSCPPQLRAAQASSEPQPAQDLQQALAASQPLPSAPELQPRRILAFPYPLRGF